MTAALGNDAWLGLIIGNTRLHWALFERKVLLGTWHTPHYLSRQVNQLIAQQFAPAVWQRELSASLPESVLPPELGAIAAGQHPLPLCCASVVPTQTALWATYPAFHAARLSDLPLGNVYPTLGIDRALNLVGAGDRYGWPVLVIDAGTALTVTTGSQGNLIGGAILPGLATQLRSLSQQTATLPSPPVNAELPPRWATSTPDAVRSGIVYGLLATVQDFAQTWHRAYPTGKAILTGGDAPQLHGWLSQTHPSVQLHLDLDLAFWGLCRYRYRKLT